MGPKPGRLLMDSYTEIIEKADIHKVSEKGKPGLAQLHELYLDTSYTYRQFMEQKNRIKSNGQLRETDIADRLIKLEWEFVQERINKNPAMAEIYASVIGYKANAYSNSAPSLSNKYKQLEQELRGNL